MDVSKLVCHYHKNKEAMGVCSVCMKKLCLDCYLENDKNTCKDCTPKEVKKVKNKEVVVDSKYYKTQILKLVMEILIGALIGFLIGRFFVRHHTLYMVIAFLSFVPTFQFINRIDTKIFGDPTHTGLRMFKYFIKMVFAIMLSACLLGFILTLFEIYANASLLVKENEKNKNNK